MKIINLKTALLAGLAAILLLSATPGAPQDFWKVPEALPPDEFGNILIRRTSEFNAVDPVTFSHWIHRRKFTCRVCHFELEFNLQVNSTEITEAANKAGKFCGSSGCHDGKTAFGHDQSNCKICHNGMLGFGKEKFSKLANLPKARFGNEVDWVQAASKGLIAPVNYLSIKPPDDIAVIKPLRLEAEWGGIPAALFSHKKHVAWLDCNNCHPDIFNIKKKTTKHFSMARILNREFCGVCHLTVAFPMGDCKRCHVNNVQSKE